MAEWCQADVELEALRASAAHVQDLVLGVTGRSFSLVAPLPQWWRRMRNGQMPQPPMESDGGPDLLLSLSYRTFLN
jgi:hypothetical protein